MLRNQYKKCLEENILWTVKEVLVLGANFSMFYATKFTFYKN